MTIGSGVLFFVVVFLGGELFVLQFFFSFLFSVFSAFVCSDFYW